MSVGSHQNATFGFARDLATHGHEIVYGGTENGIYLENLRSNVEKQGFRYELFDPYRPSENESLPLDPTKEFLVFGNNLLENKILADFLHRVKPDLILLDIHLPLYGIACAAFKIPLAFISTEAYTERHPYIPPLNSVAIPQFTEASNAEINKMWDDIKINRIPRGVQYLIEELAKSAGVDISKKITERSIVLFGLRLPEILLWPSEFEFCNLHNPEKLKYYVGAWIDSGRQEDEFDWSGISSQNIIYCTIGTVLADSRLETFVRKLFALADALPEFEFIISVGRILEKITDLTMPANVHVFRTVPQLSILKKSKAMITLGGANSLKEAISLGVPVLCYPFHNDQFGNSSRIIFHKLGLRGNMNVDMPHHMKEKLLHVMSDEEIRKQILYFRKLFNERTNSTAVLELLLKNDL